MDDTHQLSRFPVTRYWHLERNQDLFGLAPPGVPQWLLRFDWLVGWRHGWADVKQSPRHVYCHPMATDGLLRYLRSRKAPRLQPDSFLVVGGEDTLLSAQNDKTLRGLSELFEDIYYEAYDSENASIEVMPIGLQEHYLRGAEDAFFELVERPLPKTRLAVCAFGAFWPTLNAKIEDRARALEHSSQAGFIDMGPFDREAYFQRLSISKYMICPLGNGIQAPKLIEALLNRCIPIMSESIAARKLSEKGVPILVVQSWSEVTEPMLESRYEALQADVNAFFETLSNMERWWEFSFDRAYQP